MSGFKDCLTRQVSEAISIWQSPDSLLNSKNEYITNCIRRVTVQEDQLERKLREIEEEQENAKLAQRLMEFRNAKSREGKREGDVDMSKLPPPKKAKLDTPSGVFQDRSLPLAQGEGRIASEGHKDAFLTTNLDYWTQWWTQIEREACRLEKERGGFKY